MSEPVPSLRFNASPSFSDGILATIPNLRAFAYTLCGDQTRADDLVQDTLLKAWDKQSSYTPGTNLKAWLFTILRNTYFSDIRKKKREVEDPDGIMAGNLSVGAGQQIQVDMRDMVSALKLLPDDQRESLLLVAAEGFSYDEAADISNCAVGTVKSRVNRARKRLSELMHLEADDTFGLEPHRS
jgi:RNA polymerase sigma-70 factor (ECF subfamily)